MVTAKRVALDARDMGRRWSPLLFDDGRTDDRRRSADPDFDFSIFPESTSLAARPISESLAHLIILDREKPDLLFWKILLTIKEFMEAVWQPGRVFI